jgi:chromosome segregation ATPase
MKNYKVILVALLLGIIIFGVYKYILSLKEQIMALEDEGQALMQTLEKERELEQKLTQENSELQDNLKVSEEKLTRLNDDFAQVQDVIEQLNSQASGLIAENTTLKEKEDKLIKELTRVYNEKKGLQARLSSITEPKKAIKELNKQVYKVGTEVKEKIKAKNTAIREGNYGFLIKNSKSTYPAKVRIEVKPLSISQ